MTLEELFVEKQRLEDAIRSLPELESLLKFWYDELETNSRAVTGEALGGPGDCHPFEALLKEAYPGVSQETPAQMQSAVLRLRFAAVVSALEKAQAGALDVLACDPDLEVAAPAAQAPQSPPKPEWSEALKNALEADRRAGLKKPS